MAKTTIFIPDDLNEELQAHRGRINVSRVCQDALRRELARFRDPSNAIELDEALLTRLRDEKTAWEERWREVGYRLALEAGSHSPYAALQKWGNAAERWNAGRSVASDVYPLAEVMTWVFNVFDWDDDSVWSDALSSKANQDLIPALREFAEYDPNKGYFTVALFDSDSLRIGWLQGINTFWKRVKEAL